jgi:predicted transglutaminase-like cysteine proteinase
MIDFSTPLETSRLTRFLILLASLGTLTACSQTGQNVRPMALAGNAFAPPAFSAFCERDAHLCDSVSGRKIVELTAFRQQELSAVNAQVNRRILQREDRETSGREDVWRLATKEGDCEDIAIAKKAALLQSGWPASALLLTVARQPHSDEGHTVLTVRTDGGDFILDNQTSRVKPWSSTPYRYFARQSQDRNGRWDRIAGKD